jgi:hypothetical protein
MAAPPTVSPSNLEYTLTEGDRLSFRFQKGNGAYRIVVMKEGSPVTTLPVNGTDYNASSIFGTGTTAFNGTDGFVVYKNSNTASLVSVAVTNLKPATVYHIAIFEFNGTGVATEYNTVALTGSRSTVSAPATQGSFKQATNIAGNTVQLNWNLGSGARRLVVARKGSPVDAVPSDLQSYTGSTDFSDGIVVSGDNYVVYSGATNTFITVNKLEPNTTYHFALFEYNGSSNPVYTKPAATFSLVTNAGPTRASGPIIFSSVDGNRLALNFSKGNGMHQLIIVRKGAAVTAQPVNGALYEASTVFGNGYEIADDQFVVNSLNNDRMVTNLDPSAIYHFRVYEFDIDANGNTYYLTSSYSQVSQSTATPPVNQVSGIIPETLTGSSLSLKYTANDSKYRLIVVKAGSAVDAVPVDLTKYTGGNANYGQGYQITPGNYVINGATNSTAATINSLTPGVTYHIAIWGWNGVDYPVYKQDPARIAVTVPNEPAAAATAFTAGSIEGNSFFSSWTGGDGARRLVIARKGAAVTAIPVDGAIYTPHADFGDGTAIEDGQFVVHDGIARAFTMKKLDAGSTYHLAVFEYNVTNNLPDYRVSTFLAGQGTTLSAPTGQAAITSVDNIQANSARINFTKGNGSIRLFVMREGSQVNAEPQDFESYSWSSVFKNGDHLGNGNYVIATATSTSPVSVSGLTPNTTYHIAVFEYNGTAAPVFLRPGATYQFTTIAGGGIVPPAINASDPSFDVDGNKLTFNWEKGDGAKRIVVMKQGGSITFQPADGQDYLAKPEFATGTDLGNGQYIVYNGAMEEAVITNLQPANSYSLAIFEYNGTGATTRYLTTGALAVTQSTATTPAGGSTAISSTVTATSVTISWQNGPGDGRIVVVKEGGNISGLPADLSEYPFSNQFENGAQIATGEYVVYAGAGSSVVVTGLDPAKTYHFSVFEYNGIDAPVYNKVNVLTGLATTTGALPLTWVYFTAKENDGKAELKWGTTDETHTAFFVVERSKSDGSFISVDTIAAQNTPGEHDYAFTDVHAPASLVQYRIRQVDIDDHFTFSRVISLNLSAAQSVVKIYPNPAVESFRVILPAGVNQAQLIIYDTGGKQVLRSRVNNSELVSISRLPKGVYNVVLNDGSKSYYEKLIKL